MALVGRDVGVDESAKLRQEPINQADSSHVTITVYGTLQYQDTHEDLLHQISLMTAANSRKSLRGCMSITGVLMLLMALALWADAIRRSVVCGTQEDGCMQYRTPEFISGGFVLLISCICGVSACHNRPHEPKDLNASLTAEERQKLGEVGGKYNIKVEHTNYLSSTLAVFKRKAMELGLIKNARNGAQLFPQSPAGNTPALLTNSAPPPLLVIERPSP